MSKLEFIIFFAVMVLLIGQASAVVNVTYSNEVQDVNLTARSITVGTSSTLPTQMGLTLSPHENTTGNYRISYEMAKTSGTGTLYCRVYEAGQAITPYQSTTSTAYAVKSSDVIGRVMNITDLIDIRCYRSGTTGNGKVQNLRLNYTWNNGILRSNLSAPTRNITILSSNISSYSNTIISQATGFVELKRLAQDVSGYQHYFSFNEPTISSLHDENTSSGLSGTFTGTPVIEYISAIRKNALKFNNGSASSTTINSFPYLNNYTFSIKVKPLNLGASWNRVATFYNGSNAGDIYLILGSDNTFNLYAWRGASAAGQYKATTTTLTNGNEYTITVSYNSSKLTTAPSIWINNVAQSITTTSSPGVAPVADIGSVTLADTDPCNCRFDNFWYFTGALGSTDRSSVENLDIYGHGNITTVIFNNSSLINYVLFGGLIPNSGSSSKVNLSINSSSDNISWSGSKVVSKTITNNTYAYGVPTEYQAVNTSIIIDFDALVAATTPELQYLELWEQQIVAPTINQKWSSVHGYDNNSIIDVGVLDPITMNISINGDWDTVKWYRNGFLIHTDQTMNSYTTTLDLYPYNSVINITAVASNHNLTSAPAYFLYNVTNSVSFADNATSILSRLSRPGKSQLKYVQGSNTYFFNQIGWTPNGNFIGCGSPCDIKTYPLDFYLRPDYDGNITINTFRHEFMGTDINIYVNDTLYGTYNLYNATSEHYKINLTGLNRSVINHFVINSSSTGQNFSFDNISYNRYFPCLYTESNTCFQLKTVTYWGQSNQSQTLGPEHMYDIYNTSEFVPELIQMKEYGINTINVLLPWSGIVYDTRPQPDGTSDNLYDYSTLSAMHDLVDNASSNGLRVRFLFVQFGSHPEGVMPYNVSTIGAGYPCRHCLINSSDSDSIIQTIIFLSNTFKNYTNVGFDLPFESFDGVPTSPDWYADPENKASFKNFTGIDKDLPHNSSYTMTEWKALWRWQLDSFWNMSDKILPTIHANGQLMSMNMYGKLAGNEFYWTERVQQRISDFDFFGSAMYPAHFSNLTGSGAFPSPKADITVLNEWNFEEAVHLIPWGSVPYAAEYGIHTLGVDNSYYAYTTPERDIINGTYSKFIGNKNDVDYTNKSISYGLAGVNYFKWQDDGYCLQARAGNNATYADYCWGLKNESGDFYSWAQDVKRVNELITIISNNPQNLNVYTLPYYNQSFNVTLNKIANTITWTVDGSLVKSEPNVIYSAYNNSSLGIGSHTVLVTADDGIDTDSKTWNWLIDMTPPASITNPQTTTGNFYINNTWTDPADADFDHVYFAYSNGTWLQNVSKGMQYLYKNYGVPGYQQNISAQTVDTSGNMNSTKVWFNATIPNNVPVQAGIGNKNVTAGSWLNFTVNATDVDSDTITYGTNASKGALNTATGNFNWSTTKADVGIYYWNFNSSDGYGGIAEETITISVTAGEYIPPTPINISYSNGTTWINHTWQAGAGNNTNSFNVSHNGAWTNGTTNLYYNATVGYSAWSNITVYAFNSSGNGTLNETGISENVKTPDAPAITYIPPTPVWISNTTGSYWVNHTWTSGSGNITDSFNVSHNGTWINGSLTSFLNASLDSSGWSNITIWAYNNTGMLSLTSISNNSQAPSAPITGNGTPNITAWFNDKNGWNQTALTVYISNSVIFNVTINQSISNVSWKVEGSEEQNTSSLQFTRAFNSLGSYNVTAQGFNQNGSSNVVYTVVAVITGPGGGTGTDWDFARGWVKYPNGTAISGVAVITSVGTEYTDGSGYYSFGYSFIHGDTYNFNFTKSGHNYSSQDITFSTGDYQIVNATLDVLSVPPVNGTPIIASWSNNNTNNDNLSMTVLQNTTVLFNATANQTITSWVWTTASIVGGNGTLDTSASYNFTANGTTQISIYGINGNGTTQTKTWTVQVGNGTTGNNSIYGFDTTMDINLFYFIMVLGGVLFYLALRSYAGIRMALGWLTVGVFVAMAIFFAKGGVITTSFVTDTLGVTTVPLVLGISSSLLVIFYIILAIIAMLVAIATSS